MYIARIHKCISYVICLALVARGLCKYITSAAIVEERYSFYFLCTRISLTPTMILGLRIRSLLLLSRRPRRSHHHSSPPTNCKLLGICHHARVFLETPFAVLLVIIIICWAIRRLYFIVRRFWPSDVLYCTFEPIRKL